VFLPPLHLGFHPTAAAAREPLKFFQNKAKTRIPTFKKKENKKKTRKKEKSPLVFDFNLCFQFCF
jgi:hypothetical protein